MTTQLQRIESAIGPLVCLPERDYTTHMDLQRQVAALRADLVALQEANAYLKAENARLAGARPADQGTRQVQCRRRECEAAA